MENGNFMLWLAWFAFGTGLVYVLWKRYLPAVLQPLPERADAPGAEALESGAPAAPPAPAAWLYCEEGTVLDRKAEWFALRPGGQTVIGRRPRAATSETLFIFLNAEDIREDHVRVTFDPAEQRYRVEALPQALVLHNNEKLEPGERVRLSDGDTLDLGRISRFRFTLTGPEED